MIRAYHLIIAIVITAFLATAYPGLIGLKKNEEAAPLGSEESLVTNSSGEMPAPFRGPFLVEVEKQLVPLPAHSLPALSFPTPFLPSLPILFPSPNAPSTIPPTANQTNSNSSPRDGGISNTSSVIAQENAALPPKRESFKEPAFGTRLRRITDSAGNNGFGTHIYSQLQAFSSDNKYILLIEDGSYIVRRLNTLEASPLQFDDITAPRWQPARSHTLVFYTTREIAGDVATQVQYGNADTGAIETVYAFPLQYEWIKGNQSFDELSYDGTWMAGMASMKNGDHTLFSLDLKTKTLGAQISLNELYETVCRRHPQYGVLEPDWVGVSPLGKYLVIQWQADGTSRCNGLETFNIQTGAYVGRVYDGHQHGDLGVDADGVTEFFMTFEMTSAFDNNRPSQGLRVLPGPAAGVATPRYLQTMDWGNQAHISCQGPHGVCLVTSGSDRENGYNPFEGEVWLQYTDGRVLRLAHHRSTECGYWVQPRASLSRDGAFAVFASDWGMSHCTEGNDGRGEAFVLTIP